MHTYTSLFSDLEKSGLKQSDTVMIHSSVKSVGEVDGRADTILDVLMDYFGESGLLAMPTLTWSNVNAAQPVYKVNETPSVVGTLPELFRRRPGVIRSLHPTHSLAAFGKDAKAFVAGHENFDTPAGIGSPWHRLIGADAKIVFLGVYIGCNTFLHGVEEWAGGKDILTDSREPLVSIDENGIAHPVPSRRHVGDHSHFYHLLEPHFKALGALTRFTFGDAPCRVLDARQIAAYTGNVIKRQPAIFTEEWNREHPESFEQFFHEDFPTLPWER